MSLTLAVSLILALSGATAYASSICASSGGCHICWIYNPDGSYGGTISSGCG